MTRPAHRIREAEGKAATTAIEDHSGEVATAHPSAKPLSRCERASEFLTTRAAASYVGFKTTGGLRKARLEGRIFPVGRRGGRGTYVWSVDALDRFLRGEPPATMSAERSGAPPLGDAHEEAEELEVVQEHLD